VKENEQEMFRRSNNLLLAFLKASVRKRKREKKEKKEIELKRFFRQ
jgi:hypothetical protein